MTTIEWNREYCRLNYIPYDARQNQDAWKAYFKSLLTSDRRRGANVLKDPDDYVQTAPVLPEQPKAPSVAESRIDLTYLLTHAEAQVSLIKSLIAKQ